MVKKAVRKIVKQLPHDIPLTDTAVKVRALPVQEAYARLKSGEGSVHLPDVKRMEIRYYRKNNGGEMNAFIRQRLPELAYANPNVTFVVNRLGTPLQKFPSPERQKAAEKILAAHAAKKEESGQAKKKLDEGEAQAGSSTSPAEGSAEGQGESQSALTSTEGTDRADAVGQMHLSSRWGSGTKKGMRIVHAAEDGTLLRRRDIVKSKIVFDFYSRPSETLEAEGEVDEILQKVLSATNATRIASRKTRKLVEGPAAGSASVLETSHAKVEEPTPA